MFYFCVKCFLCLLPSCTWIFLLLLGLNVYILYFLVIIWKAYILFLDIAPETFVKSNHCVLCLSLSGMSDAVTHGL